MQLKKWKFVLLVMGCMFLSSSALAEQWGDFEYYVLPSNNVVITNYTGFNSNVVIPDTIAGMPVVIISSLGNSNTITRIFIPKSVTGVGGFTSSGLTVIDVDADNPNYSSQDGVLYNKTKTALLQYPRGKSGAFENSDFCTRHWAKCFFSLHQFDQFDHPEQRLEH